MCDVNGICIWELGGFRVSLGLSQPWNTPTLGPSPLPAGAQSQGPNQIVLSVLSSGLPAGCWEDGKTKTGHGPLWSHSQPSPASTEDEQQVTPG